MYMSNKYMHIVYNEHVHVQCSECTMHMYKDVHCTCNFVHMHACTCTWTWHNCSSLYSYLDQRNGLIYCTNKVIISVYIWYGYRRHKVGLGMYSYHHVI